MAAISEGIKRRHEREEGERVLEKGPGKCCAKQKPETILLRCTVLLGEAVKSLSFV